MFQDSVNVSTVQASMFVTTIICLFVIPGGMILAFLVRRATPSVNMINAGLVAGFVIVATILFAALRQIASELAWYTALTISLVVSGGAVFYISYVVKRALTATAAKLADDQVFKVQGEDVRNRPKNLRRR